MSNRLLASDEEHFRLIRLTGLSWHRHTFDDLTHWLHANLIRYDCESKEVLDGSFEVEKLWHRATVYVNRTGTARDDNASRALALAILAAFKGMDPETVKASLEARRKRREG